MENIYNPKNIEEPIYNFWEKGNYFSPHGDTSQESYCIMMPPPNITGQLHLGHAFQQTIMDFLIRYHRMRGKNTLWQIGMDHAGIATQILIEHKIYNDTGKVKHNYTRDELIKKIWSWKNQSEASIIYQMKRLGNSVDWTRKRFTMDAEMSYAVKEAFIRLYQKNLIYRGKRLVNWDPKLQTAISDLEVINKQKKGSIWYIVYQLDNNSNVIKKDLNHLIVATTRPETILGDAAVAVHPEDSRYKKLTGQYVITPITNRRIPIIVDKSIDMLKGTGCVKITPAHDFNDYTIGKKHNLPMINIFSLNGKILKKPEIFDSHGQSNNELNYNIPQMFHGLDSYHARKKIISECNKLNLLHNIKTHESAVPYNDRTGTIIEPMLTDQWYIRTKHLAQQAMNAVKQNIINFVPQKYTNMYFSWMENIQDWCISRQIWWGHRIPAWYDHNNNIYVGHCEKDIRIQNKLDKNTELYKDNDVLDTWFSSSLWTFSSLGWPKNTDFLNIFHPTNIVISGFDIIFFWIARMIMLTMHFIKNNDQVAQIPFKTVYITGLVRDEFGKKMSKSKGNIIDPIDMIDGISIENLLKKRTDNMLKPQLSNQIKNYTKKQFPNGIKSHGADSLRFTLIALASSGRDIHWDINRLTGYHNFCNKLWNASRFVLIHTKNKDCRISTEKKSLSLIDRWIITKFNQTVQTFHKKLEIYRFNEVANILHEFIWHQFCDWYIELTKPILYKENIPEETRSDTRHTLITLLESLLRLAHPIIPFITEKIWQEVKIITGNDGKTIMLQPFPKYDSNKIDAQSIIDMEWIQHTITKIRTIRKNMNLTYKIPLQIAFRTVSPTVKKRIIENHDILSNIAQLESINFITKKEIYPKSIAISLESAELLIRIPGTFNKNTEINRLNKKLESIYHNIETIKKLLNNNDFIRHAPKTIITNKQKLLNHYEKIRNELIEQHTTIKIL